MPTTMRTRPLNGIRVLDLTRLLPGPLCTLHLADLGADVIKVEDPGAGDYARHTRLDGRSGPGNYYQCINRNKRSLRVDLRRDAGRAVFLDLAAGADALIEGFRPGVMERLGLGYDAVRARNRRIVYCSLSGYGQDGPYRDRAGHDINYCAIAGVLEQSGPRGGDPVPPNFQIADLAGGALSAAMAMLAALLDAARSGEGRYLDVAMSDCTLAHAVMPFATWLDAGAVQARGDAFLSGGLPCYGVYRTGDGKHLAVGALEEKFWRAFCEGIGRPDLAPSHLVSGARAEQVRGEVAAVIASQTRAHWVERLSGADCCVTPVLEVGEAMDDPQLRARGMFVQAPRRDGSAQRQLAFPVKMSDFDFEVRRPAPEHGEHGREILSDLGYDAGAIDALEADGVI